MSQPDEDDELFKCWCGAEGVFEEMFSDCIESRCGGLGVVYCYCGGDFCVCHHHGEEDCEGCEDCRGDDDGEVWY